MRKILLTALLCCTFLPILSKTNESDKIKTKKSLANFTVYFKKPTSWAAAKVYFWNATPTGSLANATWPGVNMTLVCGDWYKYDFSGINSVNVIFNSGTGQQSPDLLAVSTSKYYDNGWLTTVPTICPVTTTNVIDVYFENTGNWAQPKVYCWSPTPSSYTGCSAYPGTNMTKVASCGNWWKYTFSGITATNLIISDGGTTNKTVDLNRNGVGMYSYSWTTKVWTTGAPNCTPVNQKPVVNINTTNQTFQTSLSISLNATDDITASPSIRYTLDGTNPTTSSTLYSGPFNITSTTTIKAIAIDGSGLLSDIKTGIFTKGAVAGTNTDVMIQGFYWESYKYQTEKWYVTLKNKAAELGSAGIDVIWMPPPSQCSDQRGYLPTSYFNLNASTYGSYTQLTEATAALKSSGLKTLADIVINHRNGTTAFADFTNPNWDCSALLQDDEVSGVGGQIQPCSGRSDNEGGDRLVNQFFKYDSARDINHYNVTVQNDIKQYQTLLKQAGFDGWRYDLSHGYPGWANKLYNDASNPYMSVGEVWWDFGGNNLFGISQFLDKWVNSTSGSSYAFDFASKIALAEVFRNGGANYSLLKTSAGKPMGFIGINPSKSVTFVENHDTWRSEINEYNYFAIGDGSKHIQSYAYILTHPGVPCIFWDHFFKFGTGTQTEIKKLIQIRKQQGLHSTSTVNIVKAETGLYAAIIDNKVAMKMGANDWNPGTGWTLSTSGNQYAVWIKTSAAREANSMKENVSFEPKDVIIISPNPVKNNLVKMQIESYNDAIATIKIVNLKGNEVYNNEKQIINKGINTVEIAIPTLISGNYIAVITLNNIQRTVRFIVE
ncbi:starch-binding protein [Flavobacterium sp.]|uniref:starch-binding protein n=1 Tax=Flavobacterium sp. TaxID=239 RepID=UPI00286E89F7|nr:starch-binding protein [Flavobacterium sp.]